jgi:hypothetical protein
VVILAAGCSGSDGAAEATTSASTTTAAQTGTAARQTEPPRPLRRREWRSRFLAWLNNVRPAATIAALVATSDELRARIEEEYRTPLCRNRGALDVRPNTDVWP